MKKMTCLSCGSTDVFWFEERVEEYKYKLKKNGDPYKRPYAHGNITDGAYNYECANCGSIGDGSGRCGLFEMKESS